MKKNLYNKRYFQERDYLDPKIASAVENLVKDNALNTILDVGCGTGQLVKYLNQYGFNAKGCDLYAEGHGLGNNFIRASATSLPLKSNSLDLITSISVIEHLKKIEVTKFLTEAKRVLKNQGYIFLVTPNYNSPWRVILGKKWFGYSDPTHINFYTPSSLSMVLQENGFERIKFRFKTKGIGLINYLLVSTYFWIIRNSFYIAAQKL